MTDTKITIVCEEGEDHITDISLTAERNYTSFFTEAFSTQEKPLGIHLIEKKDILSENAAKVVQSKFYLILLNLSVTA